MVKNYIRIAWRNLRRNTAQSVINIGGLAFGMAVAMVIFLWVWDELGFDRNFRDHDHIARVIQNVTSTNADPTDRKLSMHTGGVRKPC